MKRSAPLKRYTALRPGKPLRRVKPIRRISAKRRKTLPARARCLDLVWKRSGGKCEAKVRGVCIGVMHTGHEPLKRSRGGDETDPAQVLAVCFWFHLWIGDNEAEATRRGLLIGRNKGAA